MMVSEEELSKMSKMSVAETALEPKGRYSVDHRALLFGSRFGRGDVVNTKGKAAAIAYAAAEQEELQLQNEAKKSH
ncbi:unnamed protein product [Symbiodinium necroappetens]|uniref:Uncharacterized protein n=1 Tax=Symbiodinium necroappetens TaxID=1628268 RepID=A0A812RY84_9DINO|nr:unnamed protein product [Symbiodinium necroappetens]